MYYEGYEGDRIRLLDENTVENVVLLLQQKPDDMIEIDLDLDELDATSAETKATYQEMLVGKLNRSKKCSGASKLIKMLVDSEVIVSVTGHEKGKYRF